MKFVRYFSASAGYIPFIRDIKFMNTFARKPTKKNVPTFWGVGQCAMQLLMSDKITCNINFCCGIEVDNIPYSLSLLSNILPKKVSV